MLEPVADPAMDRDTWLTQFVQSWRQGQHVVIMGPTGSGKTSVSQPLLCAREYVIVLAVKRNDATLDQFRRPYQAPGIPGLHSGPYEVIRKWPPRYNATRVVIWFKPKSLRDVGTQAQRVYDVLDNVFVDGGWTVFIDDTGYVTGTLGLKKAITVLLNQGRSSGISVVSAMTQPASVVQQIPTETLRQARHFVLFKFDDERDIEAIARILGRNRRDIAALMAQLNRYPDGHTDFLAVSHGQLTMVRNARA